MDVSTGEALTVGITVLAGAVAVLFKMVVAGAKECKSTNVALTKKIGDQSAEHKALMHGVIIDQKQTQVRSDSIAEKSNAVMEKVASVMEQHTIQSAVDAELRRETLTELRRRGRVQ